MIDRNQCFPSRPPRETVIHLRFFVVLKTSSGKEIEVATRMKSISELCRVFLISECGLLAQFDNASINRHMQIHAVDLKIRKIKHVTNTRTIISVESASKEASAESTDTFAIIRVQPRRMREVLNRLEELPDIRLHTRYLIKQTYSFKQVIA
jgi:hypothetical protein